MKKIILPVILIIFILSDSLLAMGWPSGTASLVRNFGANDRGKPVMGMLFSGGEQILAAENGEIIFSRAKNDPASRLPSPLGAWTAVDHGDGLISIYSRYSETSDIDVPEKYVEKNEPIAVSGTSGWSSRNGFFFMLFDRRERRWINPAMIITPVQETRAPQIISVDLRNSQGVLMQARNLSQGRYTVVVNTAGGTPLSSAAFGLQPFAPLRIVCSINGAEAGSLSFEAVSARDGVLMISRNGLVPVRQIYAHFPAFEAAEVFLTRGQVNMEVIVQDISGVTRSTVIRLSVN
ncbi:MAG: M23 family metallopeptidase [Treponema sp.]|nr:M23 family metallopeptidase [Treponema sp.]